MKDDMALQPDERCSASKPDETTADVAFFPAFQPVASSVCGVITTFSYCVKPQLLEAPRIVGNNLDYQENEGSYLILVGYQPTYIIYPIN